MHITNKSVAAYALALTPATSASAQQEPSPQGALVIAKMAGACGILDSMVQFQSMTRMEGGEAFVTRFWSVEAAKLGISVQELPNRCTQSVTTYGRLFNAITAKTVRHTSNRSSKRMCEGAHVPLNPSANKGREENESNHFDLITSIPLP